MSDRLDRALAALDVGLQSSDETGYDDEGYPFDEISYRPDLCARCEVYPHAVDRDLCAGCRLFLLGDSELDPKRPATSIRRGSARVYGVQSGRSEFIPLADGGFRIRGGDLRTLAAADLTITDNINGARFEAYDFADAFDRIRSHFVIIDPTGNWSVQSVNVDAITARLQALADGAAPSDGETDAITRMLDQVMEFARVTVRPIAECFQSVWNAITAAFEDEQMREALRQLGHSLEGFEPPEPPAARRARQGRERELAQLDRQRRSHRRTNRWGPPPGGRAW